MQNTAPTPTTTTATTTQRPLAIVPTGRWAGHTETELHARLLSVVMDITQKPREQALVNFDYESLKDVVEALGWVNGHAAGDQRVIAGEMEFEDTEKTVVMSAPGGFFGIEQKINRRRVTRKADLSEVLELWADRSLADVESGSSEGFEGHLLREAATHAKTLAELVAWIDSDAHTLDEALTARVRALFPTFMAEATKTEDAK
jgi:hypothetical protein